MKNKLAALCLAACSLALAGCGPSPEELAVQKKARREAKEKAERKAECKAQREQKLAEHERLLQEGKYWPAALAVMACGSLLQDAEMQSKARNAELKDRLRTLSQPDLPKMTRLSVLEALERDFPEEAKKYAQEMASLQIEAQDEAREARARLERGRPPSIGMSESEVTAGAWGYPQRVNRTTTTRGVSEQWVYGEGRYLYFDSGVLTAIQE